MTWLCIWIIKKTEEEEEKKKQNKIWSWNVEPGEMVYKNG